MSDGTSIEWTDATWNPVSGCTKISEGCTHCYIARTPPFRMAGRRFQHPDPVGGAPDRIGATTGVQVHPERLTQPLAWRRPRRIFVCSLADLFHDQVPDLHIARVFATMHLARAALLAAGIAIGQSEREAAATIASGMRAGAARPRTVPTSGLDSGRAATSAAAVRGAA